MSQFCISCGVENLDEAMFCKSCGEKLKTEEHTQFDRKKAETQSEVEVTTSNDTAISKVKVFIFKAIAAFIALMVFGIARAMFSAMSGSDKVTMGGILLFYGVYALLSGLFLNDKKAKVRGGWILLVYIIGSVVFSVIMNNSRM